MRTDRGALARWLLAVAAAATLLACNNELCVRHSDCDPGTTCSAAGVCLAAAGPDGGSDAGDASSDAGIDAATDAATDAELDAPPDAAVDAAPDAAVDAAPDARRPHDGIVVVPVPPYASTGPTIDPPPRVVAPPFLEVRP